MDLTAEPLKTMLADLSDYNILVDKVSSVKLATKMSASYNNGTANVNGYEYYDMLVVGF